MHVKKYLTPSAKKDALLEDKAWWIVDATHHIVGRLATRLANYARGKHKPIYSPHLDCGDHIIVINADKVRLTGNKMKQKQFVRHTGYPGGQRFATPLDWMNKSATRVLEHSLKGMLPKNRLGRRQFHNVHIYAGSEHPHQAQTPKPLLFNSKAEK